MHDTAFRIGSMAMQTYTDLGNATILEVGAQIVNGSLRSSALPTTKYVGIDIEEGDGVDLVVEPGEPWPVEDNAFDLVMATSVFEHDPAFWHTFLQMCRKTKPGGHIYVSAPSNGKVHRYPQDFWRFYPDAGVALRSLAESQGIDVTLVESFVAEREQDEWNDFCAIFRRGPCAAPLPTNFIWERVACTNAITWQSPGPFNPRENTEDQLLLQRDEQQIDQLLRQGENERSVWNIERQALAQRAAEAKIAQEKSELMLKAAKLELEQSRESLLEAEGFARKLAEADRLLKEREHRIADLESNLRQRQEEISQAWTQLEAERVEKGDVANELEARNGEIEDLCQRLREADGWVFKLAGARREAEQLRSKFEEELSRERELRISEQYRLSVLSAKLEGLEKARKADEVRAHALTERLEKMGKARKADEVRAHALTERLEKMGKARKLDENRLAEGHAKLSLLLEQLRDSESKLTTERTETTALSTQLAIVGDELALVRHDLASANKMLHGQELLASKKDRQLQWLKLVNEALAASTPGWRGLMPPAWRRRRQLRSLQRHGLFDSAAYLERYPDVVEAGMDPLLHYILHGMGEGRQADISAC